MMARKTKETSIRSLDNLQIFFIVQNLYLPSLSLMFAKCEQLKNRAFHKDQARFLDLCVSLNF